MGSYALFLRGIYVGGVNITMAALKEAFDYDAKALVLSTRRVAELMEVCPYPPVTAPLTRI